MMAMLMPWRILSFAVLTYNHIKDGKNRHKGKGSEEVCRING